MSTHKNHIGRAVGKIIVFRLRPHFGQCRSLSAKRFGTFFRKNIIIFKIESCYEKQVISIGDPSVGCILF